GEFQQLTVNNRTSKLHVYRLAMVNGQLWAATDDGLYRQSAPLQLTRVELGMLNNPVVTYVLSVDAHTLLVSTERHGAF
ncbi:hypothetical protein L9G15_26925, partial [Shewanella sp. A3A]|nr:hypothetical protein [Shewanella ferrihydritica]